MRPNRYPGDERLAADARSRAEAAFRKATTKPIPGPERAAAAIPGAREQVTLRIDQSVLEHFQAGGPGWQDRINDALRKLVAEHRGGSQGLQ